MAMNLRAKLPPTDNLFIYDKNTETSSKFLQEYGDLKAGAGSAQTGRSIEIAPSARAVAEKSVCDDALFQSYTNCPSTSMMSSISNNI